MPIAAPMQEDRELRPEEVAPGLWEDDELSEEEKDRLLWALANELRRLDLN